MKREQLYYCICAILLMITSATNAQTLSEKKTVSVAVSSYTDTTVQFTWNNFSIDSTEIFRKTLNSTSWNLIASGLTSTSFTDTVVSGTEYEYHFHVYTGTSPSDANGYISFGTNVPKKTSRGNILVVVDDRFESQLESSLLNLQFDLKSDGYAPIIEFVNKDSSVAFTKGIVDYHDSAIGLQYVYLIGHIPVPYSGFFAPDGHSDHTGAWPTDLYYVTDGSLWLDYIYNTSNPSRPKQSNLHYDGKFDNSYIPEATGAAISRIDFYDLPATSLTEGEMLEGYLNAASAYKRGEVQVTRKGVIDNQTANYGEGFALNGHMNFASLVGEDSIVKNDLMTELTSKNYLWMYASAFSNDTTLGSIGSVSDFHQEDYTAIFGMTFGSYFGDWDTENNLMRSMMAEGKLLSNCWAGRPNWFFHHMGQNNPIGMSAQLSVNNIGTRNQINSTKYLVDGYYTNGVQMALLGDPTLRQSYLPVISNFDASYSNGAGSITLSWNIPSNQSIDAIEIYESDDSLGTYSLLTSVSASTSNYTDLSIDSNNYYYIKYVVLDSTLSGSYFNNSVGSFIGVNIASGAATVAPLPVELLDFTAKKVNDNGHLDWHTAQEVNFSHFEIEKSSDLEHWNQIGVVQGAGNSSSVLSYSFTDHHLNYGKNFYRLKQVDLDGSYEYSHIESLDFEAENIAVFPNPSNDNVVSVILDEDIDPTGIKIIDVNGKSVNYSYDLKTKALKIDAKSGVYSILINDTSKKLVLL